jgi:hypothetical protein
VGLFLLFPVFDDPTAGSTASGSSSTTGANVTNDSAADEAPVVPTVPSMDDASDSGESSSDESLVPSNRVGPSSSGNNASRDLQPQTRAKLPRGAKNKHPLDLDAFATTPRKKARHASNGNRTESNEEQPTPPSATPPASLDVNEALRLSEGPVGQETATPDAHAPAATIEGSAPLAAVTTPAPTSHLESHLHNPEVANTLKCGQDDMQLLSLIVQCRKDYREHYNELPSMLALYEELFDRVTVETPDVSGINRYSLKHRKVSRTVGEVAFDPSQPEMDDEYEEDLGGEVAFDLPQPEMYDEYLGGEVAFDPSQSDLDDEYEEDWK